MEDEASNEEAEGGAAATDYEKQRLSRIRENEARLQALGLRRLAASPLLRPPPQRKADAKRKQKKADADEEYQPPDDDGEEEEESSSLSGEDDQAEKESKSSSRSRKKGKKKKLSNYKKLSNNSHSEGNACVADAVDDDDADATALQQAIALSLAGAVEASVPAMDRETPSSRIKESTRHKKNTAVNIKESAKNQKNKKPNKSKIQLSDDEVVAFFFSFDEVGKGYITPWDLERMAATHDFPWTEFEISKMIRCFDSDGDGRINLEDFRTIVSRCNMLQEPGGDGGK